VPVLMAVAGDTKQDAGLRFNVIQALGRMKAAAANELMRKLLADDRAAVQVQAAIALYRLTGEKVKQFPAGDKADLLGRRAVEFPAFAERGAGAIRGI